MNPVVTAATIGVGGTVIVVVAGFGASILNTHRTIAHARETRIWDKRAEAYVDAIAAVHYRHAKRDLDMRTYPLDAESARREGNIWPPTLRPTGTHSKAGCWRSPPSPSSKRCRPAPQSTCTQ